MWIVLIFLALAIGVFLGICIGHHIWNKPSIGYLRIDHSDPDDGPYIFAELNTPISNIEKYHQITLTIKNEDFLPAQN